MSAPTRAAAKKSDTEVRRRRFPMSNSANSNNVVTLSNAPQVEGRPLEKALGHQVRAVRRAREISSADLAHAAGLSLGTISKIENGQISASLSTINAIARALNIPFSSLFQASEEKRDCSHVKNGQGLRIERGGTKVGHVYSLLGAALRGDVVVEPYLINLKDDADSYAGFQHEGTEFIYMLSGELVYQHSNEAYHLKPGDSLLFDSKGLHGPVELLEWPITYLAIIIYPRNK